MTSETRRKYHYEMNDEDATILIRKVKDLKFGMTANEVLHCLGNPTVDDMMYSKEWPGKFRYRVMMYYLKRLDEGLVNEKHDKIIYLYFDATDQLMEISSQNVAGVSNRIKK